MAKSNRNYSYADRFQRFIQKIVNFAIRARTKNEIDKSPDGIFDGEQGELLVKFGEKIFYRKNDSNDFVSLSDEYSDLIESKKDIMNKGVNKNVTWQKSGVKGTTSWEFVGYFTPMTNCDCCVTGSSDG
jgi:hypothetical protein